MIRRPPRSTLDRSSAASDVYKRQELPGRGRLTGYAKATGRNDHDALYLSFTDADDYTDWTRCHSGNLVEWVVSVTEVQPA